MLDNEAWMYDRLETMIDFCYTNRYLEMAMSCPRKKEKQRRLVSIKD